MKKQFEEFNDGIVDVYSVNENNQLAEKIMNTRFGSENVGISRYYSAMAAGQKVDKTIHIPLQESISTHDIAVIRTEQYNVEKADHFKDTKPPITRLSLTALEMHRKKEFAK